MLEFNDIQRILLMHVPALMGRYEFLSLRELKLKKTFSDNARPDAMRPAAIASSTC
jgi:hypothetical protein